MSSTPNYPQRKYWKFTWFIPETWMDQGDRRDHILTSIHEMMQRCSRFTCQEERGEDTKRLHLQGCCEFESKKTKAPQTYRFMMWDEEKQTDVLAIWWTVTDKKHIDEDLEYCTKERTRVPGGMSWSKGMPEKLKDPMDGLEWKLWQKKVKDICEEEPHPRKIYWIYDAHGAVGKSMFQKSMRQNNKNIIKVGGKGADMKYHIANQKVKPKVVFVNIPRDGEVDYSALEEIKDGDFFSGKYDSGDVLMNSPHIFVFANKAPDYSKWSEDRYDVWDVSEDDRRDYPLADRYDSFKRKERDWDLEGVKRRKEQEEEEQRRFMEHLRATHKPKKRVHHSNIKPAKHSEEPKFLF